MTRKTKLFESELLATIAGDYLTFIDGNGDIKQEISSLRDLNEFCIETLAGSVRVFGSLDGTNYAADQFVLAQEPAIAADVVTESAGSYVAVTTSAKRAWFMGDYRALRFQQVGATPAQIRILASGN